MSTLSQFTGKNRVFDGLSNTGRTSIAEFRETLVDVTQSGNAVTIDYTAGNVFFFTGTAFSANYTLNMTNVPTDNGFAHVINFIHTQSATGYFPTTVNIGGVGQTIEWSGASTPTPTSSSGAIDVFSFTLLRRGSSWTVLGNATTEFA